MLSLEFLQFVLAGQGCPQFGQLNNLAATAAPSAVSSNRLECLNVLVMLLFFHHNMPMLYLLLVDSAATF